MVKFWPVGLAGLAYLARAQDDEFQQITLHGERTHCDTQPCANGGHCSMSEDNKKFTCECEPEWTGKLCDIPHPKLVCGTKSISVEINKRLVQVHGLDDSQQRVSFLDTENTDCHAVSDGSNYKLTINAPFDQCGTTMSRAKVQTDQGEELDDYIYSNKVIWKKIYSGNEGEEDIVREITLLDFNCEYEDQYLIHMIPIKPYTEEVEMKTSKGDFGVTMELFKDRSMQPQFQHGENPIVAIDEEVCVKMSLSNKLGLQNLVLSIKDCWTSPGTSKETEPTDDSHVLIQDKCEATNEYSVDVIYNGEGDESQFCFHMFKWTESMDNVVLQCKVHVCDATIKRNGISQCQCPPEGFGLHDWIYPNYYNALLDRQAMANGGDAISGRSSQGTDDVDVDYFYNDGINWNEIEQEGGEQAVIDMYQNIVGRKKRDVDIQHKYNMDKPFDVRELKRDVNGYPIDLPPWLEIDPPANMYTVSQSIGVKPKDNPVSGVNKLYTRNQIMHIHNITDDGEWFAIEDDSMSKWVNEIAPGHNMVLMGVGIALILAMIILGVLIGAYVQCKKNWDKKSKKMRELNKVREFYQGVLKPQSENSSEKGFQIPTPDE